MPAPPPWWPGWWAASLAFRNSAIVPSFVVGPIAVVALRALMPDRRRPFRLPAVHLIAGTAFVISTLVVYWSGWDTIVRLGVCRAVGLVAPGFLALRRDRQSLDLAEAARLIPYLLGIGVISDVGTFGWDILVITVFSVAIFIAAVRSRLSPDQANAFLSEARQLELDNLDRAAV